MHANLSGTAPSRGVRVVGVARGIRGCGRWLAPASWQHLPIPGAPPPECRLGTVQAGTAHWSALPVALAISFVEPVARGRCQVLRDMPQQDAGRSTRAESFEVAIHVSGNADFRLAVLSHGPLRGTCLADVLLITCKGQCGRTRCQSAPTCHLAPRARSSTLTLRHHAMPPAIGARMRPTARRGLILSYGGSGTGASFSASDRGEGWAAHTACQRCGLCMA